MGAMLQTSATLRERDRIDRLRPVPGARLGRRASPRRSRRTAARSSSIGRSSDVRNVSRTRRRRSWPRSRQAGLTKRERSIHGPQSALIAPTARRCSTSAPTTTWGSPTIRCSGMPPRRALDDWGYGLASVRFICGTQEQHLELERRVSQFLGTEATILFSSCFDANGGVFETLFAAEDAIISDELNHASIIDGIRLSKAQRLPVQQPRHGRPACAARRRRRMRRPVHASSSPTACSRWTATSRRSTRSATWPTSSAPWSSSTTRTPSASSATHGRGTPEFCGVADRVDIYTGTFGKALGGASGGYVSSRQRDRGPAPAAGAAVPVLEHARAVDRRRHPRGARPDRAVGRPAGGPRARTPTCSAR